MNKHDAQASSPAPSHWRARAGAFLRRDAGAMTALWLLLLPAVLLIGGVATDLSMINAQKRYTQAQADLAATSAVTRLPDLQTARDVAQEVVSLNRRYGEIALATGDVVFGTYTREAGFVASADQTDPTGINALRVTVPSGFNPFLLGPVLKGESHTIRRSATATQRAAIAFSLRNKLLGLETSESVLDPVVGGVLGLGASVSAIGYGGLANVAIGMNDFLGLLSTEISADALTFEQILDAEIETADVVDALLGLGGLPSSVSSTSGATLELGSILRVSPEALDAEVGQVLPDLELNAFDLLLAATSLNGSGAGTPLTDISLALPLAQLANAEADVSLIRPAVMAAGFIDDAPPISAELAQIDVAVQADLLTLVDVGLAVEGATARATALSLNCAAGPGEALATFEVETSAASVNLTLSLLDLIAGSQLSETSAIPIAAKRQTVTVHLDAAENPEPIAVGTEVTLSDVSNALRTLLSQLESSTESERPNCGLLGCIVGSLLGDLLGLVNGILAGLQGLIADLGLLDQVAQTLLDALGIELAPAELIVSDYSCSGALVE